MAELREWDTSAANNNDAPPNGWPEDMNYSEVNNSARENMAVLARFERDTRGTLATGGTANAITITPAGTYAAYFAGMQIAFTAGLSNTGATTVNVSALGAVSIFDVAGNALSGGEIVAGGNVCIIPQRTAEECNEVGRLIVNARRMAKAIDMALDLRGIEHGIVNPKSSREDRIRWAKESAAIEQELRDVLAAVKGVANAS